MACRIASSVRGVSHIARGPLCSGSRTALVLRLSRVSAAFPQSRAYSIASRAFAAGQPEGSLSVRTDGPKAAGRPEGSLSVRADADVARLGGAIAANVRRQGRVEIRAVGPKAAYKGIKAVVNAGEYISQDEGAPPDRALAVTLVEHVESEDRPDGGVSRRTVMTMHAAPRQYKVPEEATELMVGSSTNAGKLAAAMAASLRPSTGAAAVKGMGAQAVHQALIAACVAQGYLDTDPGNGLRLAVVPRFEECPETADYPPTKSQNRRRRQLVLRLLRVEPES